MKADDIVGSLAVVVLIGLVAFVSAFWMYIVPLIAAVWAYYKWEEYEPWQTFNPPLRQPGKGWMHLLATGRVSEGHFALYREEVRPYVDPYPVILTLVRLDKSGKTTSAIAKLIRREDDDGPVKVGSYRGKSVYIRHDYRRGASFVSFDKPFAHNTWQVYPPPAEEPAIYV